MNHILWGVGCGNAFNWIGPTRMGRPGGAGVEVNTFFDNL